MARIHQQPIIVSDASAFAPVARNIPRDRTGSQEETLARAQRYAQMYGVAKPALDLAAQLGQRAYWAMRGSGESAPAGAMEAQPSVETPPVVPGEADKSPVAMAAERALRRERRGEEDTVPPPIIPETAGQEEGFTRVLDPTGQRYAELNRSGGHVYSAWRGSPEATEFELAKRRMDTSNLRREVGQAERLSLERDKALLADQPEALNREADQMIQDASNRSADRLLAASAAKLAAQRARRAEDAAANPLPLSLDEEPARSGLRLARKPVEMPFAPEEANRFKDTAESIAQLGEGEPTYNAERMRQSARELGNLGVTMPAAAQPAAPSRLADRSDEELARAREVAQRTLDRGDMVLDKPRLEATKQLMAEIEAEQARRKPAEPDLSKADPATLARAADRAEQLLGDPSLDPAQRQILVSRLSGIRKVLAERTPAAAAAQPSGRRGMPELIAEARQAVTPEQQAQLLNSIRDAEVPVSSWTDLLTGAHHTRAAEELTKYFPQRAKDSPEMEMAKLMLTLNRAGAAGAQAGKTAAQTKTEEQIRDEREADLAAGAESKRGAAAAGQAKARLTNLIADAYPRELDARLKKMSEQAAELRRKSRGGGSKDQFLPYAKAVVAERAKLVSEINAATDKAEAQISSQEAELMREERDLKRVAADRLEEPMKPADKFDKAANEAYNRQIAEAKRVNARAEAARAQLDEIKASKQELAKTRADLLAQKDKRLADVDSALADVQNQLRTKTEALGRKATKGLPAAAPYSGPVAPPAKPKTAEDLLKRPD